MKKLFLILVLVISPAHLVHAAIDETIVLYLSFDEGKGEEIRDHSSFGHHAQMVGNTEWVDGKSGKAVQITGESTDCVVVPAADSLKIQGQITLMAWIKSPGSLGSGDQWIDKNCHNGGEHNSYGIGVFGDGTEINFFLGSGASRPTLEVNQTPALEEWQHVTGTYDGEEMKIYLNGEMLEGTLSDGSSGFDFQGTNDSDLRIGCAKDRAQYTFNGAIDEVIIYRRALDEEETRRVMNSGPLAVSPAEKLAATWAGIKKSWIKKN